MLVHTPEPTHMVVNSCDDHRISETSFRDTNHLEEVMKPLILILTITICIKGLLYYVGPGVDEPALVIEDGKPVVCEVKA